MAFVTSDIKQNPMFVKSQCVPSNIKRKPTHLTLLIVLVEKKHIFFGKN